MLGMTDGRAVIGFLVGRMLGWLDGNKLGAELFGSPEEVGRVVDGMTVG